MSKSKPVQNENPTESAPKKKTFHGKEDWAKFLEKRNEHFREIWSMRPLAEGKIKGFYAEGHLPKYGGLIDPPVTKKQIEDMSRVMQAPFELAALRVFLLQCCNEVELDSLTWRDILYHFQRYNCKPKEACNLAGSSNSAGGNGDMKSQTAIAEYMAISSARVSQLCREGKLVYRGDGRGKRISLLSATQYLAEQGQRKNHSKIEQLGKSAVSDARSLELDNRKMNRF